MVRGGEMKCLRRIAQMNRTSGAAHNLRPAHVSVGVIAAKAPTCRHPFTSSSTHPLVTLLWTLSGPPSCRRCYRDVVADHLHHNQRPVHGDSNNE